MTAKLVKKPDQSNRNTPIDDRRRQVVNFRSCEVTVIDNFVALVVTRPVMIGMMIARATRMGCLSIQLPRNVNKYFNELVIRLMIPGRAEK